MRASSTLPFFAHWFQTAAQKIDACAMTRTACSTGDAMRPKGPNERLFLPQRPGEDFIKIVASDGRRRAMGMPVSAWMSVKPRLRRSATTGPASKSKVSIKWTMSSSVMAPLCWIGGPLSSPWSRTGLI